MRTRNVHVQTRGGAPHSEVGVVGVLERLLALAPLDSLEHFLAEWAIGGRTQEACQKIVVERGLKGGCEPRQERLGVRAMQRESTGSFSWDRYDSIGDEVESGVTVRSWRRQSPSEYIEVAMEGVSPSSTSAGIK